MTWGVGHGSCESWYRSFCGVCLCLPRFSSANSRRVRTAERNVRRRIPSHLTMTGQIADHFAQRKIVATDEFLEGTPSSAVGSVVSAGLLKSPGRLSSNGCSGPPSDASFLLLFRPVSGCYGSKIGAGRARCVRHEPAPAVRCPSMAVTDFSTLPRDARLLSAMSARLVVMRGGA